MIRRLAEFSRHNAIALLALLIACSGTAYAAIPNGSVTTAKIKNGAVTTVKIKNNAVTTAKIKKNAIPSNRIQPKAINRSKIKDGAIDGSKLAGKLRVKSSGWVSGVVAPDQTIDGTTYRVRTIAAPEITAEALKTHALVVYFTFGSNVLPLPYTSRSGGAPNTASYVISEGQPSVLKIIRANHDGTPVGFSSQVKFRYVLIPVG